MTHYNLFKNIGQPWSSVKLKKKFERILCIKPIGFLALYVYVSSQFFQINIKRYWSKICNT